MKKLRYHSVLIYSLLLCTVFSAQAQVDTIFFDDLESGIGSWTNTSIITDATTSSNVASFSNSFAQNIFVSNIPLSTDENKIVRINFDLKVGAASSTKIMIQRNSSPWGSLSMTVNNGVLNLMDNDIVEDSTITLTEEAWHNLTLVYYTETMGIELYHNGVKKIEGTIPTDIISLDKFVARAYSGNLYLDNILLTTENIVNYFTEDFESGVGDWTNTTIITDPTTSSNVGSFANSFAQNIFASNIPVSTSEDKIVNISFDLKVGTASSTKIMVQRNSDPWGSLSMTVNNGVINLMGNDIAEDSTITLTEDEWHEITLLYYSENMGVELYHNGVLKIEGVMPSDIISFDKFVARAYSGNLYLDNIVVNVRGEVTPAEISAFSLEQEYSAAVIDQDAATVNSEVLQGSNMLKLAPTIALTNPSASISPASGDSVDFTNPVEYTITNSDGSEKVYTITITEISSLITGFEIPEEVKPAEIDQNNLTIDVLVEFGTEVTSLIPTISTLGVPANITPSSGVAQDFTSPVTYTLTNSDASTVAYQVSVVVADSGIIETVWKEEDFEDYNNSWNKAINVIDDSELGSKVGEWANDSWTSNVFANPVPVAPSDKTILEYTFKTKYEEGAESKTNIQLNAAPWDLISFEVNDGAFALKTVNQTVPILGEATITQDEWHSVRMLFTSEDNHFRLYIDDEKKADTIIIHEFTTFSKITSRIYNYPTVNLWQDDFRVVTKSGLEAGTGILDIALDERTDIEIDTTAKTILVTLAPGTSRDNISPVLELSKGAGYTILPNEINDSVDYSQPVEYVIEAEDKSSTTWTVTYFTINYKDITSVKFDGQAAPEEIFVDNDSVHVEVLFGTGITSLKPTITISDYATFLTDTSIAYDFSNTVTYSVQALDKSVKDWKVAVSVGPEINDKAYIESFTIPGQEGEAEFNYADTSLTVYVTNGTNISAVTPVIKISKGADITPTGVQDLTSPVDYTVTAEDNIAEMVWTVNVNIAPLHEAEMLSFNLAGADGIIGTDDTVRVAVPYGTNLKYLKPVLVLSNSATVSPDTSEIQDFRDVVTYEVTAEDGINSNSYYVKASIALNAEAYITNFLVPSGISNEYCKIDNDAGTITGVVDPGGDIANLTPTIYLSDFASVDPGNFVSQDFTVPVTYTVTAQDGTTKQYVATIYENFAAIDTFALAGQGGVIGDNDTITVSLSGGTDISTLKPYYEISRGATISPDSSEGQDFTNPVEYVVYSADSSKSTIYTVVVDFASGLNNAELSNVSMYPNPVVNELVIESQNQINVYIYNAVGELVIFEETILTHTFNLSGLSKGSYIVMLEDVNSGTTSSQMIIKQ